MATQSIKQRAYWAAKRRFNPKLMGKMPDRWWTEVRKVVLDVMVRSSDRTGACSISLCEIANRAFTTKGNASKIVKALEDNGMLQVKRERKLGKYKSEQNAYRFVPAVWALVSTCRADRVFSPSETHTQVACQETDNNIYNNPHKGIKKTSYIPTPDCKVSCQNQSDTADMVSLKQVGNGIKPARNRPNGLCGCNASRMAPPVKPQRVDTPSKGFSREKPFWENATYHIRDKVVFGLAQFDVHTANRFADTHTAGEVLDLLQQLQRAYLPTVSMDKLETLFWKVKDGRYLAMRVVIHFVNTMCKVHFVAEGSKGTIRTTPERFFLGTLDKRHPPTVEQLLDSLDRMATENNNRYTMTVSERYTLYRQQKQQADAQEKSKNVYDVVLNKAIDKDTFKDIIGRLRSEYGHKAWESWFKHIKVTNTGITAPRWCAGWIKNQYLPRINELLKMC